MAFFRNTTINYLNLHYAIHAVAITGGGAFFLAYLFKAGLPAYAVFLSLAAILAGRFVLRPLVIEFAVRFGLRTVVCTGVIIGALQYPFLAQVHGIGLQLYFLCAVASLGDTIYWSGYHAYFAALGDDEHRGHQIGAREAIAALVGILSPLVTGWLLVRYGPRTAFGLTAVIFALSVIPLLKTPDVRIRANVPGAFRAALPGFWLFFADGWIAVGNVFVWQIALFVVLRQNELSFGATLASAAMVGAVGSLFLGRHIDRGHGGRAVWIAYGTIALILLLRVFATRNAPLALVANALGALGNCLYAPSLMTPVYTLAKRAPCTLRFHVATEGGWDTGGMLGLVAAAGLSYAGAPLSAGVALALPGVVLIAFLLRRYYARADATGIENA
jgi:MFS family permease